MLLQEHHREMLLHSPPESVHALDVASLRAPDLTFWGAWKQGRLTGCGALKEIDKSHGEIKSMRTVQAYLRQGVAANILEEIIAEASRRGYSSLSLETGSMQVFRPARILYQNHGFACCAPFADYVEAPHSIYMSLNL